MHVWHFLYFNIFDDQHTYHELFLTW